MRRILYLVVVFCIGFAAHGKVQIGDLYYELHDDGTAEVTSEDIVTGSTTNYSYLYGDIFLPSEVEYNNTTYKVTRIGNDAFKEASNITSVSIPNTCESIGDYAFSRCYSAISIPIPESVVSIGKYAFQLCNLIDVVIPNSVEIIDYGAFAGCTSLKSIILGNSLSLIGKEAFRYCERLTEITIPESVKTIYQSPFVGCTRLKKIVFNAVNCQIDRGYYEHYGIDVLLGLGYVEEFIFGDSVKSIPGMFTNIDGPLKTVVIGKSIGVIDPKTFIGLENLKEVVIRGALSEIGESAFYGCQSLADINIPNTVVSIGKNAFSGCRALKKINIPDLVSSVGEAAFYGCYDATEIYIGKSLSKIEPWTFTDCRSVERIAIPESVVSVGKCAFQGCSAMKELSIPSTVESIGANAFSDCENLGEVVIPQNLTFISQQMFAGCSSLKEIIIPGSVRDIGIQAFSGCSSCEKISIPKSVEYIRESAFWGIPESAKVYLEGPDMWALINFSSTLDKYRLGDNPIYYTKCFYVGGSEKPVEHLVINRPGQYLGNRAFYNAQNLKTIRVDALEIDNTFEGCDKLTDICLNVQCLRGYNGDFKGDKIQRVYSLTSVPPEASDNTFANYANATLYVPIGCRKSYEQATCWKNFTHIVESDFKDIDGIFAADYDCSSVFAPVANGCDCEISVGKGTIGVSARESSSVIVYDIYGRCIYQGRGATSINVMPGVYLIKVSDLVNKVAVR